MPMTRDDQDGTVMCVTVPSRVDYFETKDFGLRVTATMTVMGTEKLAEREYHFAGAESALDDALAEYRRGEGVMFKTTDEFADALRRGK